MKQIIFGSTTGSPNVGLTVYNTLNANNASVWNSSENASEFYFPYACTVNNFSITINVAPGVGESRRFVLRKNATTDTGLDVTISDAATSATITLTTPVSMAAGDRLTVKCVSSAAPAAITHATWSVVSDCPSKLYAISGARNQTAINDDVQRFWYPWGGKIPTAVTTDTYINRFYFAQNAKIRSFYMYLSTAPATTDSWIFYIYKNGVQEASSLITIAGAATTGSVTGLNISVAPTDNITISVISSGLPASNQFFKWTIAVEPEIDGELTHSASTTTWSTGLTNYANIDGTGVVGTNEAVVGAICPPNTTYYAKKYYAEVSAAPGAGKSRTVSWRKNSGAITNSIAISDGSTSGSDLAHTDSFTTGDLITVSSTPAGTPAAANGQQYCVIYVPPTSNNVIVI